MTRLLSDPEIPIAELRQIAVGVKILQDADALSLHVIRTGCQACLMTVMRAKVGGGLMIPSRFLADPIWMHGHVRAPGTRKAARQFDEGIDHG